MDNTAFRSAAINADESARAGFIRRTYLHLAGAIVAPLSAAATLILYQSAKHNPVTQPMIPPSLPQ